MKRYLVIGAAGHGQEVAWSIRERTHAGGERCELLFFDDRIAPGPLASGLGDVVGPLDAVGDHAGGGAELVLGIGLPRAKQRVVDRLSRQAIPWATVVHPGATLGPNVSLGEGTYVAAGAIVSVNVSAARFVTINFHCQAAHDDVLEDFVTLHPDVHLSGNVHVGAGAELGTGALAIPGVKIGAWAVLGAGCVAVDSLAGDATYVGVPARAVVKQPLRARGRAR